MNKKMFSHLMLIFGLLVPFGAAMAETPQNYYTLNGDKMFPEAMAYDSATGDMFVGSFYKGQIETIRNGSVSAFTEPGQDGMHSVTGMAVDATNRTLWVCNSEAGASEHSTKDSVGKASILVYNVTNGKLIKQIPLTGSGGNFCNDVVLDSAGNAYVTDSFSPTIWKVSKAGYQLEQWVTSPLFSGKGFNLNGIQLTANGKYLIVDKMNSGQLFRITVADKTIKEVKLSRPLDGADGLNFMTPNKLLVVEGFGAKKQGIAELVFKHNFTQATVTRKIESSAFNVPTAVKVINKKLYVVNSQFYNLFKAKTYGPPKLPFSLLAFSVGKLKHDGAL